MSKLVMCLCVVTGAGAGPADEQARDEGADGEKVVYALPLPDKRVLELAEEEIPAAPIRERQALERQRNKALRHAPFTKALMYTLRMVDEDGKADTLHSFEHLVSERQPPSGDAVRVLDARVEGDVYVLLYKRYGGTWAVVGRGRKVIIPAAKPPWGGGNQRGRESYQRLPTPLIRPFA